MKKHEDFIGSFSFDSRLAPYDIIGSVAHVKMLAKTGIIPKDEAKKIINGLDNIYKDIEKGWKLPKAEDVHFAVEKELIKRIGEVGGKMHTARSRNDQVALDLRLYLREEARNVIDLINSLQKAVMKMAEENAYTIMPGYTHLQKAQPVLFAHSFLAYAWMLQRDKERFIDAMKRINFLPLGSAALAGTSFKIDRGFVAKLLGFEFISENSIDAVSDRDFAIEFLSGAAMLAMHLSRLCEELVIFSSEEFSFVSMANEFTSGSSIMPQKRNPDVCEIIRGKTGRCYGNLLSLLTIMKGLPLSYNRDMQEDKPPVFDSVDTVKGTLSILIPLVGNIELNKSSMKAALSGGYMAATEVADYLARKGVPFRTAHSIVKGIVTYALGQKKKLEGLSLKELRSFSDKFQDDVKYLLRPEDVVRNKKSEGGTSIASVRKQLKKLKLLCNEN